MTYYLFYVFLDVIYVLDGYVDEENQSAFFFVFN